MNSPSNDYGWSQYVNLPMSEDDDFGGQGITSDEFDFHSPMCMETDQDYVVPIPKFGYNPRAFTDPYTYMELVAPLLCIHPMQMHISPPDGSGFPSECETSSDGTVTPRPNSPVAYSHSRYTRTDLEKYSDDKRRSYSTGVAPRNRTRKEIEGIPLDDPSTMFWANKPIPANAVFKDSPLEEITAAMQRLAYVLSEARVASYRHHPFLRCPVYDCSKGGYHPLLHGSRSSDSALSRQAAAKEAMDLHSPAGVFSTTHEIRRHVRALHTLEFDLKCYHPECPYQARLTKNGKCLRPDELRKHFRAAPSHQETLPESVRVKYRLKNDTRKS